MLYTVLLNAPCYNQGCQIENSKIRILFFEIRKPSDFFLRKSEINQKGQFFKKPSSYYDTLLRQNALLSCCLLIHTLFSKYFHRRTDWMTSGTLHPSDFENFVFLNDTTGEMLFKQDLAAELIWANILRPLLFIFKMREFASPLLSWRPRCIPGYFTIIQDNNMHILCR